MTKSRIFEIARRDLMIAAPVAAAAAGLGTMGRAALAGCAGHGEQAAAELSLAYLQGSETWDYLQGLAPAPQALEENIAVEEAALVPAQAVIGGDMNFAKRGARVTVHGPLSAEAAGLPSMEMKAHYKPYHDSVHSAWGYQGEDPSRARAGTAFSVPIDADTGLRLSLEVGQALAEAHFALGVVPGQAKLRRGAYLMSWAPPFAVADPGWSRYRAIAERIETPAEGMPEIRHLAIVDGLGAAVSLPAVLLTIDFAEEAVA